MFSQTLSFKYSSKEQQGLIKLTVLIKTIPSIIETILSLFIYKYNKINSECLRTDHSYLNRPIDHQSTTNNQY